MNTGRTRPASIYLCLTPTHYPLQRCLSKITVPMVPQHVRACLLLFRCAGVSTSNRLTCLHPPLTKLVPKHSFVADTLFSAKKLVVCRSASEITETEIGFLNPVCCAMWCISRVHRLNFCGYHLCPSASALRRITLPSDTAHRGKSLVLVCLNLWYVVL